MLFEHTTSGGDILLIMHMDNTHLVNNVKLLVSKAKKLKRLHSVSQNINLNSESRPVGQEYRGTMLFLSRYLAELFLRDGIKVAEINKIKMDVNDLMDKEVLLELCTHTGKVLPYPRGEEFELDGGFEFDEDGHAAYAIQQQ